MPNKRSKKSSIRKLKRLHKRYSKGIPFSAMRSRKKSQKHTQKHRKPKRHTKKKKQTKKQTKTNVCECGSHTYETSDPTPRGLGKCEECVPSDIVLKGRDKKLYVNRNQQWTLLDL